MHLDKDTADCVAPPPLISEPWLEVGGAWCASSVRAWSFDDRVVTLSTRWLGMGLTPDSRSTSSGMSLLPFIPINAYTAGPTNIGPRLWIPFHRHFDPLVLLTPSDRQRR